MTLFSETIYAKADRINNLSQGTHMVTVLILAAGQGKRMVSDTPKILHALGGKAMVHHVIDAAAAINPVQALVVISPTLTLELITAGKGVETAVQPLPLGTGNAVKTGLDALGTPAGTVMVIYGDTPLIEAGLLQHVLASHQARPSPCLTIVGMRPADPGAYGRIIASPSGQVERIVEYRDASAGIRAIPVCNSGIVVADGPLLHRLVNRLTPDNEAKEYYLTDIVALAREDGIPSWLAEPPAGYEAASLQGINSRVDLAEAENILQNRWRRRFMEQGVTLTDPSSVFFSHDTRMGRDVAISPNVTFGPGVTVGNRVRILQSCHISQSTLDDDVTVGPFAHLREGAHLKNHVAAGNFVEIKASILGAHTKVKHLSYLGNATLGENVNIGAGTITCNHNGFVKSPTHIKDNAYVGSNSCLVAPVTIGSGAMVAAGSVVTDEVPDNALAIARQRQENKGSWATQFRARFNIVF